jgi:hypothetical protein
LQCPYAQIEYVPLYARIESTDVWVYARIQFAHYEHWIDRTSQKLVVQAMRMPGWQADTPREDTHAGTLKHPMVEPAAPRERRGPGEPKPGLGRAQAESERPPAGLLANSLWTGSLGSRTATTARIPPLYLPATFRGPLTICRRPPRGGGRPGCRQHQQRRGNGNGPPGPLIMTS